MPRRVFLAILATSLATWMAGSVAVAQTSATRIHLPTAADAVAVAPGSQTALFGQGGIETKVPGPVTDRESVTVDLSPTGAVAGVHATQRLTVHGLGDFEIRVPGPAHRLRALPGSQEQPGLRKGAILWQGFSPGTKELGASFDLFPGVETARLPLRFSIAITANGRRVTGAEPISGPFVIRVHVVNVSAIPESIPSGAVSARAVASALDAVRRDLEAGRAPQPGVGDIPADLAVTGPTSARPVPIEAAFQIQGSFTFPAGTVTSADGAVTSDVAGGTRVALDRQVGGGQPLAFDLPIEGVAHRMRLPAFEASASAVPPSPSVVRLSGAYHPDTATMLDLLVQTLWRSARVAQYQQYVGNPDPMGPSSTSYGFRFAPPASRVATAGPGAAEGFDAMGFVALLFLLVLALSVGLVAWSRS